MLAELGILWRQNTNKNGDVVGFCDQETPMQFLPKNNLQIDLPSGYLT
jgi:hypothetical protein